MSATDYVSSRWAGIDARGLVPYIFPRPDNPLGEAVMTLYEPPQDVLERYLFGREEERRRALNEIYREALYQRGVKFDISPLLALLLEERRRAEAERRLEDQSLMLALEKHRRERALRRSLKFLKELPKPPREEGWTPVATNILNTLMSVEVRLSELVVHPFNARFIDHSNPEMSVQNFMAVCGDGGLGGELLVVPVAPEEYSGLAELHVKMFEMIQEKIRAAALSDEELRRLIDERGVGWVMRAFTGYREVVAEGGRLIFTENDPLRRITGVREPKYFIIDGQLRALAMMRRFEMWVGKRYDPGQDKVYVKVIDDADPLTVANLSMILNTGLKEITRDQLGGFLRAIGPVNWAVLDTVAEKAGSSLIRSNIPRLKPTLIADEGSESATIEELPPGGDIEEDVRDLAIPRPRYDEYDEYDEGSDTGGGAKQSVARQERSSRPTSTYFGGGQGSGAASWVSREEERPSQPQPLQLDEASILSALFDRYLAASSSGELRNYVFRDRRAVLRIEGDLQSNLVARGFRSTELSRAVEIWYTDMEGRLVTLGGQRFRVTFYGPVLPDKYCPKCRRLVVLSPMRCLFCGEVLDDEHGLLPHRLSHRPD
jgi:hypothetical protein